MKSDKTIEEILQKCVNRAYEVMDSKSFANPYTEAVEAINAHALTVAERLIGEDENNTGLMTYYPGIEQATRDSQTRDMFRAELRTAFRKEYGESDE